MGRPIPFEEIPDSTVVPVGTYLVTVESMEPGVTQKLPERLQYREQLRIMEPVSQANQVLFDSQTIGIEDDPDAREHDTWVQSFGARRLKALCTAAGVNEDDEDRMIQAIEGQQVLVYVGVEPDTKSDGSPNPYAGKNRMERYYRVGDREPGLEGKSGPMQRTPTARPAPQQQATRPAPAQARPAPKPAPAQARPNAPTQGATRAPLQRPAPARPAPAPRPKQPQDVICSLCGDDENGNPYTVPEDQFEAHVQEHEAQAGNA